MSSATPGGWRIRRYSLPGTKLDGEGAAPRVYLKDARLPSACCMAAMPAMYEELSNLLSYRNVVDHHCQLGIVHRTLLWERRTC